MGYLAKAFPTWQDRRWPLSRDQFVLLLTAVNEMMLGVETYLAHLISGTVVPREWIPVVFGPTAGALLLLAGLLAHRKRVWASLLATVVLVASIGVGLLGAYFRFVRAILPSAPPGARITVDLLIWAPPLFGPLAFAGVGLMGLSAAWPEAPADSGVLLLPGGLRLRMPFPKSRAYLMLVGLGALTTMLSSVLDHARAGFTNPWLWVPTLVGVFATVVAVVLAAVPDPRPGEVRVYVAAMGLLILTGVVGVIFHIQRDVLARGLVVAERFLRGAPVLAPLLFADIGLWGLIVLLPPDEG